MVHTGVLERPIIYVLEFPIKPYPYAIGSELRTHTELRTLKDVTFCSFICGILPRHCFFMITNIKIDLQRYRRCLMAHMKAEKYTFHI
jgi:hypothetical protein